MYTQLMFGDLGKFTFAIYTSFLNQVFLLHGSKVIAYETAFTPKIETGEFKDLFPTVGFF